MPDIDPRQLPMVIKFINLRREPTIAIFLNQCNS